jgi:outer membrane protein TolC
MKVSLPLLVAALALLAASCKVGPNYTTPKSNVASHWQESPAITNRPYIAAEEYWWKKFEDPVLEQLVESAFRNNLSLQVAGVRVLQARAQLNTAIGNLFPQQQNLSGAVNYTRLNDGIANAIPGIN